MCLGLIVRNLWRFCWLLVGMLVFRGCKPLWLVVVPVRIGKSFLGLFLIVCNMVFCCFLGVVGLFGL